MCRTFVFAGRRGTLEGSQAWRQRRKSTPLVEKSPRRWFANELCVRPLVFVAPGRDLVSNLVNSPHLRTLLAAARTQARPILATWTDPDRTTSIDLGASTDSETPTLSTWAHIGPIIELPCDLARYRDSLPRSARHRARSIWPGIELPCRAQLTNDTISKKND